MEVYHEFHFTPADYILYAHNTKFVLNFSIGKEYFRNINKLAMIKVIYIFQKIWILINTDMIN